MKKTYFIMLGIAMLFLTSLTIINYNCVNLPPTLYHYLTLSEMPRDVYNNSLPIATATANFDNMPLSVGLNGQPNNTTDAGATLGRVLFYDVDLSKNRTISCASCHIQKFGFSDSARFSKGFLGGTTPRNSMGLIHARFHKGVLMFWDGRASSIEDQVTRPIRDAVEMGMTAANTNNKQWDSITNRIRSKSFYGPLFQAAFGTNVIDSQRIALALAQFVRSINTYNSKYRIGVNTAGGPAESTPFPNFTAQENLGKNLFMDITRGNCQACHTRNLLVPQGAQNNGVDGSIFAGGKWRWTVWTTRNDYIGKDSGFAGVLARGRYTGILGRDSGAVKANIGRMKVPSLINISATGPYMHDGRYKTLEEVINFYSDSVKNNDYNTLSLFLRKIDPRVPGAPNNVTNQTAIDTAPVRTIHYTTTEKAALKAFLLTLTDSSALTDVKFSNPFCVTTTNKGVTTTQKLVPTLSFQAYPNPTTNELNIDMIAGQYGINPVRIYSTDGKLVFQKNYTINVGYNRINVLLPKLTSGVYIIKFNDINQRMIVK